MVFLCFPSRFVRAPRKATGTAEAKDEIFKEALLGADFPDAGAFVRAPEAVPAAQREAKEAAQKRPMESMGSSEHDPTMGCMGSMGSGTVWWVRGMTHFCGAGIATVAFRFGVQIVFFCLSIFAQCGC